MIEMLFTILSSTLCGFLTFLCIEKTDFTPTRVSTLISMIFFSLGLLLERLLQIEASFYCLICFGASFVGMCSHKVISKFRLFMALGIYIFLFYNLVPYKFGIGGTLGFCAFLSLIIAGMILNAFEKFHNSNI